MARSIHLHIHDARRAARDAAPDEIQRYYESLKGKSKEELVKLAGSNSRLDPSHMRSESRGTLINAILNAKFSRKDLDAWGK